FKSDATYYFHITKSFISPNKWGVCRFSLQRNFAALFDRNRGRKAHSFYLRRNDALTPYLYL
ncbi:MAG: hypothetical protein U0K28_03550, partial [Prevotellamassilia sp.]|nr:hypothetical protein [Prevotellamassilia sp.]